MPIDDVEPAMTFRKALIFGWQFRAWLQRHDHARRLGPIAVGPGGQLFVELVTLDSGAGHPSFGLRCNTSVTALGGRIWRESKGDNDEEGGDERAFRPPDGFPSGG